MVDLHITNGDGAANIIKASSVEGDVLPWRDPMHHGPFPAGLGLDELSELRGRYFAGPDVADGDAARDFKLRDDHLRAADKYERVVLWYEHDLLDQLQILQLLDWFSKAAIQDTSLEMICIDAFPGIEPFRGIGQLNAEQMASLMDFCQPVTSGQFELAKTGWAAFCSAEPQDLESFVSGDLSPLPYLQAALIRHLEEFPSSESGLMRTEAQILDLVARGVSAPGTVFLKNMELETEFFIGDWRSYRLIGNLCSGATPLLQTDSGEKFRHPSDTRFQRGTFADQRLLLTQAGKQVLAGRQSVFGILERDLWLGGVHLRSGHRMWTWNADQRCLQIREP